MWFTVAANLLRLLLAHEFRCFGRLINSWNLLSQRIRSMLSTLSLSLRYGSALDNETHWQNVSSEDMMSSLSLLRAVVFLICRNKMPWKQHHDKKCWSNVVSNRNMLSDWSCAILFVSHVGSQKDMLALTVLQSKLKSF